MALHSCGGYAGKAGYREKEQKQRLITLLFLTTAKRELEYEVGLLGLEACDSIKRVTAFLALLLQPLVGHKHFSVVKSGSGQRHDDGVEDARRSLRRASLSQNSGNDERCTALSAADSTMTEDSSDFLVWQVNTDLFRMSRHEDPVSKLRSLWLLLVATRDSI